MAAMQHFFKAEKLLCFQMLLNCEQTPQIAEKYLNHLNNIKRNTVDRCKQVLL